METKPWLFSVERQVCKCATRRFSSGGYNPHSTGVDCATPQIIGGTKSYLWQAVQWEALPEAGGRSLRARTRSQSREWEKNEKFNWRKLWSKCGQRSSLLLCYLQTAVRSFPDLSLAEVFSRDVTCTLRDITMGRLLLTDMRHRLPFFFCRQWELPVCGSTFPFRQKWPLQSGDDSVESGCWTWRGQDALVCTPSPSRCSFYSPLVHWSRIQGFGGSLHLTRTSCLCVLSEAALRGPGWVVKYLSIPVLKTDPKIKACCLWQQVWWRSQLWLEVCLTLLPFWKMLFSYLSLNFQQPPRNLPATDSWLFLFLSPHSPHLETHFLFICHQPHSPPLSFSLLSEQRWKKSLVMGVVVGRGGRGVARTGCMNGARLHAAVP